jgi:quercetin dioxygenase-like cupin family protein
MSLEVTNRHEKHLRLFASLDTDSLLDSGLSGSAQGFKRTMLQSTAFPGTEYITALYIVEIDGGATVSKHTHAGLETLYILEGEANLAIEGQPEKHLKMGDSVQILKGTLHSVTAVILEGEAKLAIEGEPEKHLKPGDSAQIPIGTVHSMTALTKPVKVLVTYVVEKDKPLATSIFPL